MDIIRIPKINDEPCDFQQLISIWNHYHDKKDIEINFSDCKFIRQNGVAFLGGLITRLQKNADHLSIRWETLDQAVYANLVQNGFVSAMGGDGEPWEGNSIPYRRDTEIKSDSFEQYLQDYWLKREWIHISPDLSDFIISNVLELYMNAFEHSGSPIGVFSCGQHYPSCNELILTIIDFGIGIPGSVRGYYVGECHNNDVSDERALEMAFESGFSSNPESYPRGLGLNLLKEFVLKNNGTLDVYTNKAHALIRNGCESYEKWSPSFDGTAINIRFVCNEKLYVLGGEDCGDMFF